MNIPSQPVSGTQVSVDSGTYDYVVLELQNTHRLLDTAEVPTKSPEGEALSISQRVAVIVKAYLDDKQTIIVVNGR